MAQKDNILQELNELNSNLGAARQHVYSVPDGYFDELIIRVMDRIKAMEAKGVDEELGYLSPMLKGLSKQIPYTVSQDYFEGLAERVVAAINHNDQQTAKEELESISPLLSGLKKEMPYTVPQGYFEGIDQKIVAGKNKPATKVVSFTHRKWFRYAAAAVLIGIVAVTGFLIIGGKKERSEIILAKVKKDVKKMDDVQKENLIEFLDAGMTGEETAQVNNETKTEEIKTLLQGISEEELKNFQEQTEDLEDVLTTD